MNIGNIRTPNAVTTYPATPLAEAARSMRDHHVGALVVLDPHDPQRRPQGMLTDRDILRGQIARGADLHCLTVGDVMSRDPLGIRLDTSLEEAIEAMNARAVRRAPVLDASGSLVGIVTLDDLVPAIARELQSLAELIGRQAKGGDGHPGLKA
jgi:CBS domain-containing protein